MTTSQPVWLTSIQVDRRHRQARRDLADAHAMHQRVMTLVGDQLGDHARQQAGVLYRLESSRTGPRLLVQMLHRPDLARLPDGYGTAVTGRLLLLDRLQPGQLVRYRVAANTSMRRPRGWTGPGRPGQVVALRGAAAEAWWHKRAGRFGLELHSAIPRPLPDAVGRRGDGQMRHAITQFDGVAAVADLDALREAVLAGVGRGRSYGCGLLSLLPVAALS